MSKLQLTNEILDEFFKLYDELHAIKELASEQLRTVQDQFNKNKIKVTREGREITVTEKILWDEVFYLGAACEAGKILSEKYPDVFASYKKQEEKVNEIKAWELEHFGFDHTQMTLKNYVALLDSMIDYKLAQRI